VNSNAPISTLPYADLPARWGIGVDRSPTSLRVVVPPVPSIQDLPRGLLFSAVALATLVCALSTMAAREWKSGTGDYRGPLMAAALYGSVLLLVCAFAWTKLMRRTVIEITSLTFILRRVSRGGRVISESSWPRTQIGGAKYNVSNGKMVVRIIGIEMLDIYVSPRRDVTEWVTRTIGDALRELPGRNHTISSHDVPPAHLRHAPAAQHASP
jgi:hypothetical protein